MKLRHTLLAFPAAAALLLAVPTAAFADESVQVKLPSSFGSAMSMKNTKTA